MRVRLVPRTKRRVPPGSRLARLRDALNKDILDR
jgi:hypothetical protein